MPRHRLAHPPTGLLPARQPAAPPRPLASRKVPKLTALCIVYSTAGVAALRPEPFRTLHVFIRLFLMLLLHVSLFCNGGATAA